MRGEGNADSETEKIEVGGHRGDGEQRRAKREFFKNREKEKGDYDEERRGNGMSFCNLG